VNELVLYVSVLVASAVAILTYTLLSFMGVWLVRREEHRLRAKPILFVERLVTVLRLIAVPEGIRRRWSTAEIEVRLLHAGLSWGVEEYAALRWSVLWLSLGAALGLVVWREWDLVGQFLALLMIVSGVVGSEVWLTRQVERRQLEVDLALPNLLDRLALGLEAGLGFDLAIQRIAQNLPGLLGSDLRLMVRQLERGHHRDQALDELAGRNPSTDLRAFITAVKQSDRLGTSLAKALRMQTDLLRARRRRRAEEASRRLPILIIFPLVFFFLPALMIVYLAPPVLHLFTMR
jgi:pilus assembly protein TadC